MFVRTITGMWLCLIVPCAARADSCSGVRDAIKAAEIDGIDDAECDALAARVISLHDGATNRGDALAALRLASTLCWDGPPARTHDLRAWALAKLAEYAGESDRARHTLLSAFLPPLHRVDVAEQSSAIARFGQTLHENVRAVTDRRTRADLAYLPLAVRMEVSRTWDVPWFDATARQATIDALGHFHEEFGDVASADGRPYAEVAGDCVTELRELAFGQTLPDWPLHDIAGGPISLSEYRGKVVLLVCWSSWCLPCMKAVPDEKAMVARLAGEPFVFIGINGDASRDAAQKAASAHGLPWRSIWAGQGSDGARLVNFLRVRGWPSAFILDSDGRIRAKFVGSAYCPLYVTDDVERAVRGLLPKRAGSIQESPITGVSTDRKGEP